jgi:CO/xanthine dehydrogenase FAD-binding subunit
MFERPATLEHALDLLRRDTWSILAGGTDFYPSLGDKQPDGPVLDITGIEDLGGLAMGPQEVRIGALVTWSDILRADLPAAFDGLKLAAAELGSPQIQNRATLVGNICNASPAADGVPPLLTLDAKLELASSEGRRLVSLADFIRDNRKTVLARNEIVTAIVIPAAATTGRSHFLKLGARRYLVISIVMVGARLVDDGEGGIGEAAISVGSCSAVAQRLGALEADLIGRPWSSDTAAQIGAGHLSPLSPIDDVRAPAAYRQSAAVELVRRTVAGCFAAAAP